MGPINEYQRKKCCKYCHWGRIHNISFSSYLMNGRSVTLHYDSVTLQWAGKACQGQKLKLFGPIHKCKENELL
jgi:hypothetical protein